MNQTLSNKDTERLKVERWKNIYCTKINQKKARVADQLSGKKKRKVGDFRATRTI